MFNNNSNKAVKIGILEISTQNKAILEFFFKNAGKTLFKEVDTNEATAFIIDYDSLGAKENWESVYKSTNKPGIIISIHKVDLPSTIWVAKPLTAKALTEAGHKIKVMLTENNDSNVNSTVNNTPVAEAVETIEELEESITIKKVAKTKHKAEIIEKEVALADVTDSNLSEQLVIPKLKASKSDAVTPTLSTTAKQVADVPPSNKSNHNEVDSLLESLISGRGNNHSPLDKNQPSNSLEDKIDELTIEAPSEEIALVETEENCLDTPKTATDEPLLKDVLVGELVDDIDVNIAENFSLETQDTIQERTLESPEPFVEPLAEDSLLGDIETNTIKQTIEIELPEETVDSVELEENKEAISVTTAMDEKDSAEDELQRLLEEIRQEAESNTLFTEVSKESDGFDFEEEHFNTEAEKRWSLICGNDDHQISNAKDLKKNSFNPDEHLLATFNEVLEKSKESNKVMRLKLGTTIIIIDSMGDAVYCDNSIMSDAYARLCYQPIKKDQIKVHALDASEVRMLLKKQETDSDNSHSIEAFIWTTSLLCSRGRLPNQTDLKQQLGLKCWPNLTRLESFPHAIQIAAVFKKETGSLLEITKWLEHIPQSSIFAFYNGALALDLIEQNEEKLKSLKGDAKKPTNTKNRGFFSRLLKRITR